MKTGDRVEAGQILVQITSEQIEAKLEQVRAEQENAKHAVHQARATRERTEAEITEAKVQRNLAERDFQRFSKLLEQQVVARRDFDKVEAGYRAANARLEALVRAREEARASFERAEAALLVTRGKAKEVEASLKDTRTSAPISATVLNKLAEEGEVVTAGTPLLTLVDLSDIYVKVFIPEKTLGVIRLGNPVRIFSDSFPERPFEGKVIEVSDKAEFTPKDVHVKEERTKLVFGVKVKIDNPQGYLKPGMPVDVKIKWREDVPW